MASEFCALLKELREQYASGSPCVEELESTIASLEKIKKYVLLHDVHKDSKKAIHNYHDMSPVARLRCRQDLRATIETLSKIEMDMNKIEAVALEKKQAHEMADRFMHVIAGIPPPGREPWITLGYVSTVMAPWIHRLPLKYFETTVRFLQARCGASSWKRDDALSFIADVNVAIKTDRDEIDIDF